MMCLTLLLEDDLVAVCRLGADEQAPAWATCDGFISITRTKDELSIVRRDDGEIPEDVRCERGWRLLRIAGTQAFTLTGILSSVLVPLAAEGVGIFAISTFDTDYVMVKANDLARAMSALRDAGHRVQEK